jgi:predicted GH43/DUF377 family glycosyl hydrolase
MVYCGYNQNLPVEHNIHICMAKSDDLLHWTKLGPVTGNVNDYPNKDAVILPEPVNGMYMMLHRPMVGQQGSFSIALAVADSPEGEWRDRGTGLLGSALVRPRFLWVTTVILWITIQVTIMLPGNGTIMQDMQF